jgi:hypothetical protein
MTDIRSELKAKWKEAKAAGHSGLEWRGVALSTSAPLRLVAAVREPDDRAALLLEGPIAAAPPTRILMQAEGISLADQRRPEESIFRVGIVLEREELRAVFEVLVADIIEIVRSALSPAAAIVSTMLRLEAWQACLRLRNRGLSREEQIGLMSELTFLALLGERIGYRKAVDAWQGPLDGLHDFSCSGFAIEVKGAVGVGGLLHISHLDQLESSGLSSLIIARLHFQERPDGKSLVGMVKETRAHIDRLAPLARQVFDDRLLRLGYLEVDAEFNEATRLVLSSLYGFEIRRGFPRLTSKTVPAGVVEGSYSIDEMAIANFKIDGETLRAFAGRMTGVEA